MSFPKEVHDRIDALPPEQAGELLSFLEHLQRKAQAGAGLDAEGRAWEQAAASALGDRLEELEANDDPEARKAWLDSFAQGARPCRYVPGEGFVAL